MPKGHPQYLRRCMWFNDFGDPRINPNKINKGRRDTTGCLYDDSCNYVHPHDPDWLNASLSNPPRASLYKDGIRPRTPTPPRLKRYATPEHSREPRVKEEQVSPSLSNFFDTGPAKTAFATAPVRDRRSSPSFPEERHSRSRSAAGSRGLHSPSRDLEAGRDRDKDKERRHHYDYGDTRGNGKEKDVRDYERGGYRDSRYSDREREYGRDRDRDRSHDHGLKWMGYEPPGERSTRQHRPVSSIIHTQDNWKTSRSPDLSRASVMSSASEHARTTSGDLVRTPTFDHDGDRSLDAPMSLVSGSVAFGADQVPATTPAPLQPVASYFSFSNSVEPPHPPGGAMSSESFASSSMLPPPAPNLSTSTSSVVPPLPSFLTTQQPAEPVKKELLSLEERREIWDKRIELLAEAISARQTYGELVSNVKVLQSLAKSTRYVQSTPAVRESIDTSLRSVEKQRDDARRRAEEVTSRIYEMDFWPMRRRVAGDDAGGPAEDAALLREDEHEEMKTMVNDLNDAVNRLDRQTKEVVSYVRSRTRSKPPPPAPASATAHVPMEWDSQYDGGRGSKRRKVGDEGAYASDSGSTVVGRATPTPAPPISDSLDALSAARLARRVERLEAMYADIENMSTQAENAQTEEIGALIDTYLDRFRGDLERQVQTNQQVLLNKLEVEVEQSGNDVAELASTVADLVESTGIFRDKKIEYETERERIKQEHAALQSAMKESRAQTEAMQAQIRANIAETAALREALKHAHRPVPAPHVPSVDELAAALLPRILDTVREDIATRMAGARAEITTIVRASIPAVDIIREKVEKVRDLPEVLALIDGLPSSTPATGSTVENGAKKLQQVNGRGHTPQPPT